MKLDYHGPTLQTLEIKASTLLNHPAQKLMIMLHGQGDRKESYVPIFREINLTGLNGLSVDAPFRLPHRYGLEGNFWYGLDPSQTEDIHDSVEQSIEDLGDLIQDLIKKGHKSEDIFLFGFSAGGRIVLNYLLQSSMKFAGSILLGPRMSFQPGVVETMKNRVIDCGPLFISHGSDDEVIPIDQTRKAMKSLKLIGDLYIEYHELAIGHEISIEQIQLLREWLSELI